MFLSQSKLIALLILASFPVSAFCEIIWPDIIDGIAIFHGLIVAIALYIWSGVYSYEKAITPPNGSRVLLFLFAPLGLLYFAFGGLGKKKGGILILKAVSMFLLSGLIYLGILEVFSP